MSRNHPNFRKAMGQILTSAGVARINFSLKSFRVHGAMYAKVKKKLLETDKMDIKFDSDYLDRHGIEAEYQPPPGLNRFVFHDYLERKSVIQPPDWHLIVHESTHAVFDLGASSGFTDAEEDVAARVAQNLFYLAQFGELAHTRTDMMQIVNEVIASPGMDITSSKAYPSLLSWVIGLKYDNSKTKSNDGI